MSCHVPGTDEQNTRGADGLSGGGGIVSVICSLKIRRRGWVGDNYIRSNIIDC